MPLTLAQMHALLNDNTSGDISAEDTRDVVEALYLHSQSDLGLASSHFGPGGSEDDEFQDDSRAIPSGWTEVVHATDPGNFVEAAGSVRYHHLVAPGATMRLHAIVKAHTFSAGDYFDAAVTYYRMTSNDIGAGLVISDGTTHGAGNQVVVFPHNTFCRLQAWTNWTTNGSSGTNPSLEFNGVGRRMLIHYRIKYEAANTWGLYWSFDGLNWTTIQSDFSFTMTPTHVGLVLVYWNDVAPPAFDAQWHYFRVNPTY